MHKHINTKLIFALLCVLFVNIQLVPAQDKSYPVLANLMLNYPNRIYLSDYASPISPGLSIGLLLKDMDQVNPVQVKLKISITGNGSENMSIFTNDNRLDYLPSIELYPGTYHQVSPDILSAYLDPKNLIISGAGNRLYESNGGRLPEGPYIFTVEAYETRRGPKVSNTAQMFALLTLNEAPRWVSPWMLPKDDIMMQPVMPQLIYFSWMSQHTVSLVIETEYEIVIAEVIEEMAPHEALDLSIPNPLRSVYTSPSTFLMYDASYPFLEIGKTYACQIQAKDRQGRALFKMDGKSDILVFKYGEPCPDLIAHNVEVINSWEVNFDWNIDPAHTMVELKYREQNDDGTFSSWYYDQSEQNNMTLSTLNAGKTYEYELAGKCQSIYSEPLSGNFTTKENSAPPEKTCGSNTNFEAPENQNPFNGEMKKGTIIRAGGFDVVVSNVSSFSNGTLSGEGIIKLATFGLDFKCTFDDIFINEKQEVTIGEVQVVVDPDGGGILDLDETFNITNDLIISETEILSDTKGYLDEVEKDVATLETRSTITEATKSNLTIVKDNLNTLLNKNNNGQISLSEEEEQRIQAAIEGIDRNMNKEKVKVKDDLTDTEIRVYFKETKNQLYGFDTKEYDAHIDNYEKLEFEDEDYFVPWKSVKSNGNDQVTVEIKLGGENISADDIKFVNSKGLVLPVAPASGSSQDGIQKTLTINGVNTDRFLSNDAYHINAIYTEKDDKGKEISKTVGKLSIQTYPDKEIKVKLVPVGKKASAPVIDFDKIFKQAVMKVNSQSESKIIVSDWDDKDNFVFDNGETGFLSNYTDDMNEVIDKYTAAHPDYDKDAYYIFVLNYKCTNSATKGYMPRQRQFGFLFGNTTDIATTAAHELAHGAFNLEHTWLDYPALQQGSTKNLMDYGGGDVLRKYQWDLIHHPRMIIPWLQDEEGARSQESSSIHDHLKKRLAELKQQKGMEFIAILHCETCQEPEGSSQNLDDNKFISSNFINFGQSQNFEGKSLPVITYSSGGDSKNIQAQSGELFLGNAKSCFALYFGKTNDLLMEGQQNEEGLPNMPAPALYVTDENFLDNILYDCTSELGDWSNVICEEKILSEETAEQVTAKYLDDLITHVETCIQNTSPGSTPTRIHYYTDQRFNDENAISKLISGLASFTDQNGETRHDTKAHVFVSSGTLSQEQIDEINNYALSAGEHKIWLHKNQEGHWELKSLELNSVFDEINKELTQDMSFQEFIAGMQVGLDNSLEALDEVTTGIYEGLDWLAKGIRYARIPESIFNCNKESEYKPQYSAFYNYAIQQVMPIQVIIREVLISSISKDVTDQTIKNCLNSISQGQVEFAFYCGLWNGLIEIVGSVPDLLKLVVTPFTSKGRQEFSGFIDGLSQFKKENEATGKIECSGSWCAIKTSLGEQFDPGKCCQFAEILGEIAGPIIISFIAPQIAGTAVKSAGGKVIVNIIKCLQWCDKIGDPFRYASISFRYIKSGLSYLRTQSKRLLVKIENEIFKGAILMGDVIHDISKPLDEVAVSIAEPGGQKFRATFTEGNVSKGGLLLDNELVKLLEKRGVQLSKLGKLLKQAGDENQILNKLSKTNLENDNLIKFVDDLIASPELLSHFIGKSVLGSELLDLGNAWRIIKEAKTTESPILRKNIDNLTNLTAISKKLSAKITPDELQNAIKQLANNTNPPVLGEGLRILSRLKEKPGVEHLIKDLGIGKGKYKGASWVMRYVDGKGDDFIKAIQEFELKDLYIGGTKGRIYDIALTGGKRFELKSWDDWYPSSIQKQFIDDLANPNIKNLEDLFWIFEKSDAIPDVTTLKGKVISVLNDNKKLLGKVPLDKVQKWTDDLFLNETEKVDALIKMLDKTNNFNKVFEVVL